jgi:hypothetical protein
MRVRINRVDDRGYTASAARADGVTVSIQGFGFAHGLPRALAHLATEDTLELRQGFWGSVAAGALLPGMSVAEGQSDQTGSSEKTRAITEATALSVADTRGLVAAFDEIVHGNLDARWPQVEPKLQKLTIRRGARSVPLTKTDIARVAATWRALQARWDSLPTGGTLEFEWKTPIMSGSWPAVK